MKEAMPNIVGAAFLAGFALAMAIVGYWIPVAGAVASAVLNVWFARDIYRHPTDPSERALVGDETPGTGEHA